MSPEPRNASVVVIGAGQAGLSAAYHLQRRGFVSALEQPDAERTFVVLDAEARAGGAWQHRWPSLLMRTVNGIFDLPGMRQPPVDPEQPSRIAVPRYFDGYEQALDLPILRPVHVLKVDRLDDDPHGRLGIETDADAWRARVVLNATGTWTRPNTPAIPGRDSFVGRQLHTADYRGNADLAGHRVAIVGGGISAVQLLEEVSRVATTFWYARREPRFIEGEFEPETTGREVIARVLADAEAGRPMGSVVSYTGLAWTAYALAAKERGVLERRPMFVRVEPQEVVEADGSRTPVDTILWATGFSAALDHLAPLALESPLGGIARIGTQVAAEPRVHLIGIGPSQSTVGANRAGRDAVLATTRFLSATDAVAVPGRR